MNKTFTWEKFPPTSVTLMAVTRVMFELGQKISSLSYQVTVTLSGPDLLPRILGGPGRAKIMSE